MPMSTSRCIEDDDPSPLDPIVRVIDFSGESAVRTVTILLRKAWQVRPPEDILTADTLPNFLRDFSRREDKTILDSERDPDTNTIDTPWRKQIADFWRHVYADVTGFLLGASGTAGHMKDYDVLPLFYPPEGTDGSSVFAASLHGKVFQTNVLVIPTFVGTGVQVRIMRDKKGSDGKTHETPVHTLNTEKNGNTICYLRRGFEFHFYVDGAKDGNEGDVAAVLAMCILCVEDHGDSNTVTHA